MEEDKNVYECVYMIFLFRCLIAVDELQNYKRHHLICLRFNVADQQVVVVMVAVVIINNNSSITTKNNGINRMVVNFVF